MTLVVQEPWPFPPHARMAPAVVAALDLAEAADAQLVDLGTSHLAELTRDVVADWLQRPPRRQPVRPVIVTGPLPRARARKRLADDLVWDDRAEQDATQLVGLLFVAATPLRRTQVAETLKVSHGRLARACAVLQMPADAVIAFHRDLPPARLRRANWLEHPALGARQGLPVPLVAELPAAPALPELNLGAEPVVQPAPATTTQTRRERTNGHQQALDFGDRW